jgi:hypothetical protein
VHQPRLLKDISRGHEACAHVPLSDARGTHQSSILHAPARSRPFCGKNIEDVQTSFAVNDESQPGAALFGKRVDFTR